MKLPIEAYENRVLRQKCTDTPLEENGLINLIENMWETMEHADGCGLAAPQIGKTLKLFIVDTKSAYEALKPEDRPNHFEENDCGITETFINANIQSYSHEKCEDYEGCLSIPNISIEVKRPRSITISYYDINLQQQVRTFGGYTARVIQHEFDHTQGILYIDRIHQLSRKLIDRKLKKISRGQVKTHYLMKHRK